MSKKVIRLNNIFTHLNSCSSSAPNNKREAKQKRSNHIRSVEKRGAKDPQTIINTWRINDNLSYFSVSGGLKAKGRINNNTIKDIIQTEVKETKMKSGVRLDWIDIGACLRNSNPMQLIKQKKSINSNSNENNNKRLSLNDHKSDKKNYVNQAPNKSIFTPSNNILFNSDNNSHNNNNSDTSLNGKGEVSNPFAYSKKLFLKISEKKTSPKLIQISRSINEQFSLHSFRNQKIPTDDLLFTDTLFLQDSEIYWLRLNEIFDKGFSIIEKTFNQTKFPSQGILRDSNVLSTIIALSQNIVLISKLIITDTPQKEGCYQFIFRLNGIPIVVIIDDQIPCFKGTKCPIFARGSSKNVWPMLIEKALAKVSGSYSQLQYIPVKDILNMLIRFPIVTKTICPAKSTIEDIRRDIREILDRKQQNKIIIAKIDSSLIGSHLLNNCKGLKYDAYYVIKDIFEETIGGQKLTLVRIKAPISNLKNHIKQFLMTYDGKQANMLLYTKQGFNDYDFNGDWSNYSNDWNEEASFGFLEYHSTDQSEGIFWMAFEDFSTYFNSFTLFNYVTPLYSIHINILSKNNNNTVGYSMRLNRASSINISLLTNNDKSVQIALIKVKRKEEENDSQLNCFEVYSSNINALPQMIYSKGTYFLFLYMNEHIEELKMNLISSSEIFIQEVQINDKLKPLLLREIGLYIFKQTENEVLDMNRKEEDQVFAYWPLPLPKTNLSFVVVLNSKDKEMEVTFKWNLTNCVLIPLKSSIDAVDVNVTVKAGDYFVIPIMTNISHQSPRDSSDKTTAVANKEPIIDFEFIAVLPKVKTAVLSDLEEENTLHSLLSIEQWNKTDDVYYEYVL